MQVLVKKIYTNSIAKVIETLCEISRSAAMSALSVNNYMLPRVAYKEGFVHRCGGGRVWGIVRIHEMEFQIILGVAPHDDLETAQILGWESDEIQGLETLLNSCPYEGRDEIEIRSFGVDYPPEAYGDLWDVAMCAK